MEEKRSREGVKSPTLLSEQHRWRQVLKKSWKPGKPAQERAAQQKMHLARASTLSLQEQLATVWRRCVLRLDTNFGFVYDHLLY